MDGQSVGELRKSKGEPGIGGHVGHHPRSVDQAGLSGDEEEQGFGYQGN